jgi:histo-blood group ABO system transferase
MIATGKYDQFVAPCIESARKHLKHDVTFYVHSDRAFTGPDIVCYDTMHLPWPLPTLLRFHILTRYAYDEYAYYVDVDTLFIDDVGNEILGDLVAVRHHGFAGAPSNVLPYERDNRSACSVEYGHEKVYCCGGFQGGRKYREATVKIKDMIASDLKNKVVPEWHDESAWNRYLLDNPPDVLLPPTYMAMSIGDTTDAKILALDKNHDEIRS